MYSKDPPREDLNRLPEDRASGQLLDLELDTVRGEDDIGHALIDLKTPHLRSSPNPNTLEE